MHRTRGADAGPRDRRHARGTATETGSGSASLTEVWERNVRQVSLDAGPEGPSPESRGPGPKAASPSTGLDRLPKSQVRLFPAVGSGDPRPFLPGCPEGQTPPGQATDRRRASPGPKTLGARAGRDAVLLEALDREAGASCPRAGRRSSPDRDGEGGGVPPSRDRQSRFRRRLRGRPAAPPAGPRNHSAPASGRGLHRDVYSRTRGPESSELLAAVPA